MEAKSQQIFYNKAVISLMSSKLSLWSMHFQDMVQKVDKWLIIILYFRFMLCIALTLSNDKLAHFHYKINWVHAFKTCNPIQLMQ